MRALLWIIAIFAVAAGVAMLASSNDGYVLVMLPPWRVQISFNLAVIGLLLALFVFHIVLRLIGKTLDLPGRVGRYRARRREKKATVAINHAVRALYEGRYDEALKSARLAWSTGAEQPGAALIAARAAHALGDEARYREWLGLADRKREGHVARVLTEAEFALADGNHVAARGLLEGLHEQGHRNTVAKRMLLDVARAEGAWDEVLELLPQLRSLRMLTVAEVHEYRIEAHLGGLLTRSASEAAITEYWRALPREVLTDVRFLTAAVPILARANKGGLARSTVEQLLAKNWDPELVRSYALCVGNEYEARGALAQAEKWLRKHPEDPHLLYVLGRQCMMGELWGKAQSYLEASLQQRPSVEGHLALAELMELLERPAEASAHYRKAAESAALAGQSAAVCLPVPATAVPAASLPATVV